MCFQRKFVYHRKPTQLIKASFTLYKYYYSLWWTTLSHRNKVLNKSCFSFNMCCCLKFVSKEHSASRPHSSRINMIKRAATERYKFTKQHHLTHHYLYAKIMHWKYWSESWRLGGGGGSRQSVSSMYKIVYVCTLFSLSVWLWQTTLELSKPGYLNW